MKLKPHQQTAIAKANKSAGFGYFLDMGIGKTFTALAEAEDLYQQGLIDNIIVACPKGAEHVWEDHADMILSKPTMMEVHRYPMAKKIKPDSVTSRTLLIADESQMIKTPTAVVTKLMLKLAFRAGYRRILSGTPLTNSPFDAYSQMLFLNKKIFHQHGITNYTEFKTHFAEQDSFMAARMMRSKQLSRMPFIVKRRADGTPVYKNLDLLQQIIDSVSITISKEQADIQLPDKIFKTVKYQLTEQQREQYTKLHDDMYLEIENDSYDPEQHGSGVNFIEAQSKLVLVLRLHQLICDHEQRHELALSLTNNEPAIIFSRFLSEIDSLSKLADSRGIKHFVYTGKESQSSRKEIVRKFQAGEIDLILANAHTAGRAITLTRAKHIIYSSLSYNWEHFKQSQDRAHRIGLEHELNLVFIEAEDTIDQSIRKAIEFKTSVIKEIFNAKSVCDTSPNDIRPKAGITHSQDRPVPSFILR